MSIWKAIVANPLLGETLYFGDVPFRASLKGSTSATFSLTSRWLYAEGQCERIDPMFEQGDYINRPTNGIDYFVATVESEPLGSDIAYIYLIGCNAEITVQRSRGKEPNENGDLTEIWETIHENVKVYHETVDRSGKMTNDGLIPQAMHNMFVPEKYKVSIWDRILMKTNVNGEFTYQQFRVESIGTNIVDMNGKGVTSVQMSMDLRV